MESDWRWAVIANDLVGLDFKLIAQIQEGVFANQWITNRPEATLPLGRLVTRYVLPVGGFNLFPVGVSFAPAGSHFPYGFVVNPDHP